MTPLLLAASVAVVLPVALLVHSALVRPRRTLAIASRNLTRGLISTVVEVGSLESRGTGWGALLRTLTPEREASRVRRLLDVAGRPGGWTMTRVLWSKLWLGVGLGLAGTVLLAESPGLVVLLAVVGATAGGYFLPNWLLSKRGEERQKAIARALPDTLDQMTIAVEAGLGFEAAFARVASSGSGPLGEELQRTLQDVTVGRPRREAYGALVRRTHVPDLQRFVSAVNQADAYGIAISDVLRVQADELRVKRRQRAEEQAMKVGVKITFPLMACILPALLIVVVGPAIMGIAAVMS
jgi:tight adherence protein C